MTVVSVSSEFVTGLEACRCTKAMVVGMPQLARHGSRSGIPSRNGSRDRALARFASLAPAAKPAEFIASSWYSDYLSPALASRWPR